MDTHVGDLKRLANDHVAIAGRIMEDWKRMGFLDDHSKKALDWISEFSLLKIFELEKEEDRSGAVEAAGKMLLASFDEEILRGYVSGGEGGCFVEAVLYDRSLAAGSRCRKLRLEYCLHAYGRRYVLRRGVEKVLSASPLGKVASFLKGGSKEAERKREAALERWEREDRVQRIVERYRFSEKDAAAAIKATDRRRKTYYEKYTQGRWGSIESHQMLLNVSRLGMERTVEIIRGIYEA